MIVVIVVLGFCAATLFPKMPGMLLREPEPWRSARRFLRTAQYAQELAIARESPLVLRIDMETGSYRVISGDGLQESTPAFSADLQGQLPRDVTVTAIDSLGASRAEDVLSVEFRPDGWCDPSELRFTASDGRTVMVVIAEHAGEMELRREGPVE